jgi:hypothetical protein
MLGEDEVMDFWRKSTAACPTYGVCYWCFGGGPTNMYCQVCRQEDWTYKNLLTADRVTIAAEWVARFFATTFLFARGDRTHNGLIAEVKVVAIKDVKIFVHERWHGRNEDTMFRIGTGEVFQEGMTWNCHSQCLKIRSKTRQVEILIIEPEAWELFQEGMTWNCHSQCLKIRSKTRQVEILIIEPEALYNRPV